jgi:ribosomal protein L32
MAVPKRKRSRKKRDQRFAGKGLEKKNIIFDSATGVPRLSHYTHKPKREKSKAVDAA